MRQIHCSFKDYCFFAGDSFESARNTEIIANRETAILVNDPKSIGELSNRNVVDAREESRIPVKGRSRMETSLFTTQHGLFFREITGGEPARPWL
jgi:hypothetical protein